MAFECHSSGNVWFSCVHRRRAVAFLLDLNYFHIALYLTSSSSSAELLWTVQEVTKWKVSPRRTTHPWPLVACKQKEDLGPFSGGLANTEKTSPSSALGGVLGVWEKGCTGAGRRWSSSQAQCGSRDTGTSASSIQVLHALGSLESPYNSFLQSWRGNYRSVLSK